MTRQEINLPELALTFISLLILSLFFSASIFMPTSEDLLLAYGQKVSSMISMDDWISNQVSSKRIIPAALGWLVQFWGYDYFHLTGFWILGFAAALWFCTREFVHYIKLPLNFIPLLILAIGFHGFWAELMQSVQAYINYSLGLFSSGMALLCARLLAERPFMSTGAITFWIWVALASYEPMALIPLFAISLVFIRDFFLETTVQEERSLKDVMPIIIGFFCAGVVFLISYTIILKPAPSVSSSWDALFSNGRLYLVTLPSLFFSVTPLLPYHLIFPIHERLIYALAQIGIGIGVIRAPPSKIRRLALIGLIFSILASAGPMGIFITTPYLTTPRSLVSCAFFHASLMIIAALTLVNFVKKKYPHWPHKALFFGAMFTFIGLSFSNQLSILYERARQYAHDEIMASNILADLKKEGVLYQGSPIAVMSPSPYHSAQLTRIFFMQFPVSTFWGNLSTGTAMLSRASGITLKTVPYDDLLALSPVSKDRPDADLHLYKDLCAKPSMPWEIRKKANMTIVCLALTERPDHHASSP